MPQQLYTLFYRFPRHKPLGLPGFPNESLPACHGLRTPADLHTLARNGRFVLPSASLKTSASATSLSRSCTSTSGCAITPTACRILCLRLAPLVRLPSKSKLRQGPKARYGWVASPYEECLSTPSPAGTFTLQDSLSFAQRDNAAITGRDRRESIVSSSATKSFISP